MRAPVAYVVTFQPEHGRDGIRDLRFLLKIAGRHLHLRAVDVRERQTADRRDARRRAVGSTSVVKKPNTKETSIMVSARKYGFTNRFYKLEELHGGPALRECIELVQVNTAGKYGDRLELIFEPSGKKLSLNKTSVEVLIEAFGEETDNWPGRFVEIYAGEIDTKDGTQDAILVRAAPDVPADPAVAAKAVKAAKAKKSSNDIDDTIPF